jgi:hypothetical protein
VKWIIGVILIVILTAVPLARAENVSVPINGTLKRPTLNLNFVYNEAALSYAFINLIRGHDAAPGPSWKTGVIWNSDVLDSNGYPCSFSNAAPGCIGVNPVNGRGWIIGGSLPSNRNYPGVVCFQGVGSGAFSFTVGGHPLVFERVHSQTCAGFNGGSSNNCTSSNIKIDNAGLTFTTMDDNNLGWCLAFKTNTNSVIYQNPVNVGGQWSADDPNNKGAYVRDLAMYEISDGADFAAGKIFRTAWKREIVELDPAFVRFMNWGGGNSSPETRWENRATASNQVGYAGYWLAKPFLAYDASAAGTNQLTVAAATGTRPTMEHGEVAFLRAGSNSTSSGHWTISAIANNGGNIGQVTTSSANNVVTGDIVIMPITGMAKLNQYPVCAAAVDTTHFLIYRAVFPATPGSCSGAPIDVSTMGTFKNGYVTEFYTINVGNRGVYPIVKSAEGPVGGSTNFTPAILYYAWNASLSAGSYYYLTFNKNIPAQTDGNGNWVYGAWVWANLQDGGWPVAPEIEAELILELNELRPQHPINMWVNTGSQVLIPNDPDYSVASDYPANLIKTILKGANGFAGLASGCPQCIVVVEDSNETWNFIFDQESYFAFFSNVYCDASNGFDTDTFSTYHSELVVKDIKNSGYATQQVGYVLSGQGNGGSGAPNYARITGKFLTLSSCSSSKWGPAPAISGPSAPITYYDFFAIAPYFNVSSSYKNTNITSLAAQWANDVTTYGPSSSQAIADLDTYVSKVQTDDANCPNNCPNSVKYYQELVVPCLESLLSLGVIPNLRASNLSNASCGGAGSTNIVYGKRLASYEGGWNELNGNLFNIQMMSCTSGIVTAIAPGNGYTKGQAIQVTSAAPAQYNGFWTVNSVSGSQFTYYYDQAGGTCPGPVTIFGQTIPQTNAYLQNAQKSTSWAHILGEYCASYKSSSTLMGCGLYTMTGLQWSYAYPDTYGLVNGVPMEGAGLYASWKTLGRLNQQLPYLLNRDLDPLTSDNSPAFMNHIG